MSHIYLDESGCLGFDYNKSGTSKYFVITFLFCNHSKKLETIPKKIFKGFTAKQIKIRKGGVLHCNKEDDKTRIKLLNLISNNKDDIKVMAIILNKKNVYTKLQDEKVVLYNYVVNILLSRINNKNILSLDNINLIASKRETNKFLNDNFKNYLENQIKNKHGKNINVEIKSHYEDRSLQVVDFISWSIFRKYEFLDGRFYEIIKNNIIEEDFLF